MALLTQPRYSFEEFLSAEREAEIRHEYVDGHVFDMVGATENHNIIVANITALLVNQMKGRPCLAYANDMKVRVEAADASKYPDIAALCGERKFFDDRRDVLLNPTLTIEVLSHSTEAYDRGEKFAIYRRLPSLKEYVLVSQTHWRVEVYVCQPDGRWLLTEYNAEDDKVPIDSVDCILSLREIYDKIEFFDDRGKNQDLTP